MRFSRNATGVLIGAVIVVVVFTAIASNRLFGGLTASIEDSQFQLMRSILEFNLRGAEGRALARAAMIADLATTRQALATRDRPRLLTEYGDLFRVQREQYGMDQLNFQVPPAVTVARLQSPDQHGDDVSSFRAMVVAVNQSHVSRKGLEIARSGPAVFGTVPVVDAQRRHVGTVEVGMNIGTVLDALKAAYGFEMALYIEERPLREFATSLRGDVLGDQNRFGRYLRFHSTHSALMQRLVTGANLASVEAPTQYTRDALGVPYGVLLVPLRDAMGRPLGVMAMAQDFRGSRAAAGRSLVWQALLALFGIVLLSGVVLVVVRGLLLRPLAAVTDAFAALAGGDRARKVEDPEALCEELQTLAGYHETLRAQAARGDDGGAP
jgi:methyl-accepting chemotaxis protein